MKWIVRILIPLLSLIVTFVLGYRVGSWHAMEGPVFEGDRHHRRSMIVGRMQSDLKLTDEQRVQIEQLLDEQQKQLHKMRREFRPEFERLRQEMEDKISQLLSPEQKEKFHEMAARRKTRKLRGEGPLHRGP